MRSSKKRAIGNKRVLKSLRKFEKSFRNQLKEKKADVLELSLKTLFKLADRAKKRGIIKGNTASRKKSRFAQKVSELLK